MKQNDKPTSQSHSCTLEKDLENKLRIIAVEQNENICDVTKKALAEYAEREQIRRECKIGIIRSDDPLCKQ